MITFMVATVHVLMGVKMVFNHLDRQNLLPKKISSIHLYRPNCERETIVIIGKVANVDQEKMT